MFTIRYKTALALLFALTAFILFSCALSPLQTRVKQGKDRKDGIFLVRANKGDTLKSLALKYYKDASKAWLIKEYNQISSVRPGQAVVIPDPSFKPGGLDVTGYQTIPVLAYHQLSENKKEIRIVSKTEFEKQILYLKKNNYNIIDPDQLSAFLAFKAKLPSKSLVITFNGGWKSIHEIGVPILKKHGMRAAIFICTDKVGGKGRMSWDQLAALSKNGFSIQSMTRSGLDLTGIEKDNAFKGYFTTIKDQLVAAKTLIEKKTGKGCYHLAYPEGKTNSLAKALAHKTGYKSAYTLEPGPVRFFTNPYQINRNVVSGNDTLVDFKNKLALFVRKDLK